MVERDVPLPENIESNRGLQAEYDAAVDEVIRHNREIVSRQNRLIWASNREKQSEGVFDLRLIVRASEP